MSLLKYLTAMALLGLLMINCKNNLVAPASGESGPEAVPVLTFAQLDRPVDCSSKRIAGHVHYVINDKDRFEELIHCNSHTYPLIDFSRYTLLIGSYLAPATGYVVAEQQVTRPSGQKKLVHHVTIREAAGGFQALAPVTYYAVVPKIRRGIPVEVKVNVVPGAPQQPQRSAAKATGGHA